MEELLKKFIDITNSKYERQFIIGKKSSEISEKLPYPIVLDENRNYKLGLTFFSVYNSIRNITESNNKLKIYNGEVWKNIEIRPGSYEVMAIQEEISKEAGFEVKEGRKVYYI